MIAKISNLTSGELNSVQVEMYIRLDLPQMKLVAVLPVAALQQAIEVTENYDHAIIKILNVYYYHCFHRVARKYTEMQISP